MRRPCQDDETTIRLPGLGAPISVGAPTVLEYWYPGRLSVSPATNDALIAPSDAKTELVVASR